MLVFNVLSSLIAARLHLPAAERIVTDDPNLLIEDAHKAVQEPDHEGIYTYCINLDPNADDYLGDIFGKQYTVIDNIEHLPEKPPQCFMS